MALSLTEYLSYLQQSGLTEPAGIDYHLEQYQNLSSGAADDAAAFGQLLVDAAVLTEWQNNHLQHGRWKGFHLGGYTLAQPRGDGEFLVMPGQGTDGMVLRAISLGREKGAELLEMLPRLQAIDSPFVVRVLGGGVEAHVAYLIEERVDGRLLQNAVDADGPLALPVALRVISHAAQGLGALHAAGVTYLMFTPGDLLLHAGGAKVARIDAPIENRSMDRVLTIDGDPWSRVQMAHYFGPDRVRDVRADVYCLGCVLYFSLVGQAPLQTAAQHFETPPPNLRNARPDAPEMLASLFQRMLAKAPADRPQSMAEVCHVLRQTERLLGIAPE